MLFSRADIKERPHVNSGRSSVPRYVQYSRSQLTPLTTPQSPLDSTQTPAAPPTAHWLSKPRPLDSALPPEVRNSFAQRKLGNGVCGSLRLLSENSTTLDGRRSPPEGNACWTMESSNGVPFCACAAAGALPQPRKSREAKHSGCCSLLAGKHIGAFPWHLFPGTVGESCFFLRPRLPSGARCRGTQAPWEGMAGAHSLGAGTCVELVTKGPGSA